MDTEHKDVTRDPADPAEADKQNSTGDLLVALTLIAYAALMTVGAVNFRWNPRMGVITAPAFTPILLSGLVILLSLVLIVRSLRRYGSPDVPRWYREVTGDERMRRSAVLILLTGAYVAMVGRVYFPVATTVYLVAMFWYLKLGKLWVVVLSGLAGGLFISVLIPGIFRMPLP